MSGLAGCGPLVMSAFTPLFYEKQISAARVRALRFMGTAYFSVGCCSMQQSWPDLIGSLLKGAREIYSSNAIYDNQKTNI